MDNNYAAQQANASGMIKAWVGPAPTDQKSTELAALGAQMGQNRAHLRELTNLVESRLGNFAPWPQPGETATPQTSEPPPGTLASLQMTTSGTTSELSRLDGLISRLRELL